MAESSVTHPPDQGGSSCSQSHSGAWALSGIGRPTRARPAIVGSRRVCAGTMQSAGAGCVSALVERNWHKAVSRRSTGAPIRFAFFVILDGVGPIAVAWVSPGTEVWLCFHWARVTSPLHSSPAFYGKGSSSMRPIKCAAVARSACTCAL